MNNQSAKTVKGINYAVRTNTRKPESKAEEIAVGILTTIIVFIIECQVEFKRLNGIGGEPLRFDIGVYSKDNPSKLLYLIEIDGPQHREPMEEFGGEEGFKRIQEHDTRKNIFCKENGIPLVRIPTTGWCKYIKMPHNLILEHTWFRLAG